MREARPYTRPYRISLYGVESFWSHHFCWIGFERLLLRCLGCKGWVDAPEGASHDGWKWVAR